MYPSSANPSQPSAPSPADGGGGLPDTTWTRAGVDALIDRAAALCAQDPHAALLLAQEAEAGAMRLDYQRGLAGALLRRARCELALQVDSEAAFDPLHRAIALFELLDDWADAAEATNLLANVHASRHEGEAALTHHHRGLALRRRLGDQVGEAGLLNNIGSVFRDMGQFADALKYLFMSLERAEAAADARATAYALANIGGVLAELDDTARAVEYHLRALSLVAQTSDRALEGATLTSLGRLLTRGGHPAEALLHLERALAITRAGGRPAETGLALLGLGLAHQQAQAYDRAEHLLLEALSLIRRGHQRSAEAEALLALGRNRWMRGAPEAAIVLLTQALGLTAALRTDPIAGRLHELLSQIHEQQGRVAEALHHVREFLACQQRVHGQDTQRRVRALLGRAELERAQHHAENERRRGDELATALDAARESERQKQELLAQLSQQSDMLRQLAREDGLTGLANRRWLDAQLDRERAPCRRRGLAARRPAAA